MSGVAIRRRTDADLPALHDTWVETWAEARPDLDFEARRPWIVARIQGLEKNGAITTVALVDGVVAGAVIVDPATGYLDQIWVAPRCKGHGVAGALFAAARALSPAGIDLDVNRNNDRAIAFYRKAGFAIVSEGVNPVSGAPVYRMAWRPGSEELPQT